MSLRRLAVQRDANEPAIVAALEAVGATVTRLNMRDVPDLLVGFRRENYLLEVKRPAGKRGGTSDDGQRLSEGQEIWHCTWRGRTPAVVRTPEEALIAIGAINREEQGE